MGKMKKSSRIENEKSVGKLLNIIVSLIVFSIFAGLLIFGAVFDVYNQSKINPSASSILILISAILSLIYLVWALLNWRLSKIFR